MRRRRYVQRCRDRGRTHQSDSGQEGAPGHLGCLILSARVMIVATRVAHSRRPPLQKPPEDADESPSARPNTNHRARRRWSWRGRHRRPAPKSWAARGAIARTPIRDGTYIDLLSRVHNVSVHAGFGARSTVTCFRMWCVRQGDRTDRDRVASRRRSVESLARS